MELVDGQQRCWGVGRGHCPVREMTVSARTARPLHLQLLEEERGLRQSTGLGEEQATQQLQAQMRFALMKVCHSI